MAQEPPAISQFIKRSGRLDFNAVESFAENHGEQEFVRFLREPVLMGNEVVPGEIHKGSGHTALFTPTDSTHRTPLMRPPLMHLIYPFIKRNPEHNPGFFVVGHNESNDFVVPDYTISPTQAGIRRTGANRFLLRSTPSVNPTLLNNKPHDHTEVFLHEEDILCFGRYEFIFLSPSGLYCRLKGVELSLRIQQIMDSLGKADHDALMDYAIRHGEKMFIQLVQNPSLVGSGLFRGYAMEIASQDPSDTMAFLPDLTFGLEPKHLKVLGRAIYPLIPPEEDNSDQPLLRLGRHENNHVILPEGSISNLHAELNILGPGHYRIRDLGSTNGTFINDRRVPPQGEELADGDRIKMGRFEFYFLFPGSLYLRLTPTNVQRP